MRRDLFLIVITTVFVLAILKYDRIADLWHHGYTTVEAVASASATQAAIAAVPGSVVPLESTPKVKSAPSPASPAPVATALPSAAPIAALTGAPAASADATPAPSRKAPPGYLYVLRHISKMTDSGVVGVDPGTLLALTSRGPIKSRLTDGNADYEIENEYLTDDVAMADMARRTDAQSQAAVANMLLERKAVLEQANKELTEKVQTAQERQAQRDIEIAKIAAENRAAAPAMTAPIGSSLDRGAYNQHYSRPYWWYRQDYWGYHYYVDSNGRWVYY